MGKIGIMRKAGDSEVYGKNNHGKFGQLLHAKEITFTHPTTKEVMTFSCEVPEEFNKILEEYKEE